MTILVPFRFISAKSVMAMGAPFVLIARSSTRRVGRVQPAARRHGARDDAAGAQAAGGVVMRGVGLVRERREVEGADLRTNQVGEMIEALAVGEIRVG